MPVWRDEAPPKDPRHVFNRHGITAVGDENWLTASPDGNQKFPVGYFLDPGHPAAAEYLAGIYLNIVRNYAVDGIHFDYVRYPETDDRLPRGATVGYNAVNLARFRRVTGRTDTPAPGDEAWMDWRRDQVTNLVRRVSIEARAINPRIKISAALIPWGQPPSNETDFEDAAPMQRIFQDWHQWLKDGLIDLGLPMNYASETDDTGARVVRRLDAMGEEPLAWTPPRRSAWARIGILLPRRCTGRPGRARTIAAGVSSGCPSSPTRCRRCRPRSSPAPTCRQRR